MLVNSNELLKNAFKDGYAIGAYNINNLEWAKYILEACNSDKRPVILAVSEKSVFYFGGYKVVYSVVNSLINELKINVPVVLHLDHGSSVLSCKNAIDAGFTSVMIDASNKSLEENIKETNEVISYAKKKNVSVEAEVGALDGSSYTDLNDATLFTMQTGVDVLAPFIGNKHGVYKNGADLDFDLLGQICKNVKIPLALHGASGLDENKIKTAIFCGVCKININTDLQIAWANAVKKYLECNKDVYDPRLIISSGEAAIKRVVHEKNKIFSSNRAF